MLIVRRLSNSINYRFLHVCVQNKKNFILKLLEMVEKIKTDVDNFWVGKWEKVQFYKKFSETFLS